MDITPYADVNDLLHALRTQMQRCLGENLSGLYLYGSLVTGDYTPGISDVDLLAATANDLTAAEFAALRRMHTDLPRARPEWRDRIDVAYASVAALRSFRTGRHRFAIVSPGEPFHRKTMDSGYLMDWYIVRERGAALMGPPPEAVIPPIAKAEFTRTVKSYVSWLAERLPEATGPRYRSYAVLSACRALFLHRTGELAAKEQAAVWAREELSEWAGLVASALAARRTSRDERAEHVVNHTDAVRFLAVVKAIVHA